MLESFAAFTGAFMMPRSARALDTSTQMPNITRRGETRPSRLRLRQALEQGFGIQYWGETFTAYDLSNAPHGLLIVEATRVGIDQNGQDREILFHPIEIDAIRKGGRRLALGYLNLTEIEDYRDYWKDRNATLATPRELFAAPWIGPLTENGERLACYWHPDWISILEARVDRLIALGLDGLFLDDVLHYYSYVSGDGLTWPQGRMRSPESGYASAMLELVIRLSERMRKKNPGAAIVVNNGVYLASDAAVEIGAEKADAKFERYAQAIDGIVVESAFGPASQPEMRDVLTRQFHNRGISVMTVDFATQFPDQQPETVHRDVSKRARCRGYSAYVAENDLFNALYPPTRS